MPAASEVSSQRLRDDSILRATEGRLRRRPIGGRFAAPAALNEDDRFSAGGIERSDQPSLTSERQRACSRPRDEVSQSFRMRRQAWRPGPLVLMGLEGKHLGRDHVVETHHLRGDGLHDLAVVGCRDA